MLKLIHLGIDAGSAVNRQNVHAVKIFGKVSEVVGYLQAELTRRAQHHGLGGLAARVDFLQHGQTIGCRLAGAGLRQRYYIVLVT